VSRKTWIFISVGLVIILIPTLFFIAVKTGKFGHIQTREELQSYKNATASIVLSEEGEPIGKFFSENRTNVSYDMVPGHLLDALIATEDVRFYSHKGIDPKSLVRVLIKSIMLNNRSSGGGSTISQQLAKGMFGREDYGRLTMLVIKIKEAILASRLEKIFSKEEILTLYLNTVPFGENVYGVEAAARRYFNKNVEDLNIEESAVLVGLLKANNFYNPRLHPENARKRRNVVLGQMKKYDFLKAEIADSLSKLPLIQNYVNFESKGPADYFLYQLKIEAGQILDNLENDGQKWNIEEDGLIITTTLNLALQNYANESFKDHMAVMQKRLDEQYNTPYGKRVIGEITKSELKRLNLTERAKEVSLQENRDVNDSFPQLLSVSDSLKQAIKILQAGLFAIDPGTGAIKAWVGGIDFRTQPYDQVLARRQLASTFKPVLYAVALEDGMDPCYYLDNDSVILTDFEDWTPENFDHTHGGQYSFAGALKHSMNIPTFNLFLKTGFYRLDSLWRKMGFSYNLQYNPSLALGTAEANLKELAIAYASFANGGYKISPYSIESIKTHDGETIWENKLPSKKERILNDRTTALMNAILQKAIIEGTGASMRYQYGVDLPMAGKTGTSQNYADAWFAAYNPKLVIASRVGASYPSVHFTSGKNGQASILALPLVAMTLKKVQEDKVLVKQLNSYFPSLPPELASALDCPDFKEDDIIDKFKDFFKKDEILFDKSVQDKPIKQRHDTGEKKGFFKRLFKKNKK